MTVPGVFLAIGPEEFLLREYIENLKNGAIKKYGDFAVSQISFSETSIAEIKNEAFSPPLFSEKRILFITNFPPSPTPSLSEEKRAECFAFVKSLQNIPETVVLIFSSINPDRRSKIFTEMEKTVKKVERFEEFDDKKNPRKFSEWIIERVKKKGGNIEMKEAEFLKNYAGHSLDILEKEIQKLCLLCAGKKISEDDIKSLCVPAHEIGDFAFSNAIQSGKSSQIQEAFRALSENFEAGLIWNRDVISTFRTILKGKAVQNNNGDLKSIGLNPYIAEKIKNIVKMIPQEKVLFAYKKILEIDSMTKDGRLSISGNTEPFFLAIETLLHDIFGHQKK